MGLVDGSSKAFALISTSYVLHLLYLYTGEASVTVTEASVTVMQGQGKLVLAHEIWVTGGIYQLKGIKQMFLYPSL